MAEVFATLLIGIGVGFFIGLLLSNEKVRKTQLLAKYFRFLTKEQKPGALTKSQDSNDEGDEVVETTRGINSIGFTLIDKFLF